MSQNSQDSVQELNIENNPNVENGTSKEEANTSQIDNETEVEAQTFTEADIPTADDPGSRVKKYDFDWAGFSLEEFDSFQLKSAIINYEISKLFV